MPSVHQHLAFQVLGRKKLIQLFLDLALPFCLGGMVVQKYSIVVLFLEDLNQNYCKVVVFFVDLILKKTAV